MHNHPNLDNVTLLHEKNCYIFVNKWSYFRKQHIQLIIVTDDRCNPLWYPDGGKAAALTAFCVLIQFVLFCIKFGTGKASNSAAASGDVIFFKPSTPSFPFSLYFISVSFETHSKSPILLYLHFSYKFQGRLASRNPILCLIRKGIISIFFNWFEPVNLVSVWKVSKSRVPGTDYNIDLSGGELERPEIRGDPELRVTA